MKAIVRKNVLNGEISVPSSKSHTIRALVIGTLAGGTSVIRNPLPSEDCRSCMEDVKLFGARCTVDEEKWVIESPAGGLHLPNDVVNVGNSGTTMYFLASIAATLNGMTVFTGDESIRSRPVLPLLEALQQLGVDANTAHPERKTAPFAVKGPMKSGTANVVGSPSQYISSILIAAPLCDGKIRLECDNPMETPYIQMTIDWMKRAGVDVIYDQEYHWYEVEPNQQYHTFDMTMPSDWSSVAFPLLAGLTSNSEIIINNLDFDDVQGDSAVVDHLIAMGADITKDKAKNRLIVRGGKNLKGIYIDMTNIPDALPVLSVAGALAEGEMVLDNIAGTRLKETDRAKVMAEQLTRMGVRVKEEQNVLTIYGGTTLKGAEVDSYKDHRIAMAMTAAGLFAEGETTIRDAECANVTFPHFYEKLNELNAGIDLV